ncbi:autotransporter outer membrane beta-barrel domain-containing protein [Xanthobacter sp. V0B-10]|uniref:autotransporter family protein n=1 Tax=Xanthobacter albus TaxID=3119929 RepID=UPI00372BD397
MARHGRSAGTRRAHGRRRASAGCLLAAGVLLAGGARAESPWDATISNSHWYVTVPQMLAYAAPATSFANPMPIGDQTLWALGTSVNGVFTGTSAATLQIGPIATTSDSDIQGSVTPAGQITMVFTPTTGGSTTIGLGQMQQVGGITTMEMQMITGTSLLVSHWAYMTPYDPAVFTPPAAQAVPSNLSPQWAWTKGTPWRIVSPEAFGTTQPGTFIITGYKSGYFWGQGLRPDGTAFSLLGSITPQGRVLFNTLTDGTLASLYGGIAGNASDAGMALGTYDASAIFTGDLTAAYVVRPYGETAAATGTVSALGAARTLYAVAGTEAGLLGAMAPVTRILNDLSGPALSAALSQTVPVLSGAAAEATAGTLRMLGQVAADRLDAPAQPEAPERRAWMRPLGGGGRQSAIDGVPGYDMSGGGIAVGADGDIAPGTMAGAMLAFSSTSLTASADAARASVAAGTADLQSYVMGAYGTQALLPGLDLAVQVNAALVDTGTSRAIAFMGTTAEADYRSRALQAGAALRRSFAVTEALTLRPALRLDYLEVSAPGYRETGAGPLDLSVEGQTWRELDVGAELAAFYRLGGTLTLTARGSAGYDTLGTPGPLAATFAGGGLPFLTPRLDVSPWLFTAGAGLTSAATETLDLGLQYDLQASPSGYLNQIGSLRLKMRL